jgi:general stress protein 26
MKKFNKGGINMDKEDVSKALEVMKKRFGQDTLISLATVEGEVPSVRIVNSYYEDGAFYIITHALSNKMKQIQKNSAVALCAEWFTAHGIGENIGHPCDEHNMAIICKLREAFSAWYKNGHTNEEDKNTCILCIRLTDGVLFDHGTRYDLDFSDAAQIK